MNFSSLIMFGALFGAMYFLMIRPQQKRAKEAQDMLNSLRKGSEVVTIGGLHGVVEELDDTTVVLDCEGIYLTFERRAIARVKESSKQDIVETQEVQEAVETVVEETAE